MPAVIDDTYAEAFRSIYAEFLITARNRRWVEHAVQRPPETPRARSCAIARPGSIAMSAPGAMNRSLRRMAAPVRSCNCTFRGFGRTVSGAGTIGPGPDQPERAHLPDDRMLQSHRLARIFSHGPESRLFRRRIPEADRAIRSQDVVDSHARRRVHSRPAAGLRRRTDGRQSVVHGRRRRCRIGRRGGGCGGRARLSRRDHAVSRGASPAAGRRRAANTRSRLRALTRSSARCWTATRQQNQSCRRMSAR